MTQEALKLALEFIENSECGTADLEARIKEALAQTEQDHCDGYWCVDLTCKKCYSADFRFKHPPPQRTWVNLTVDELIDLEHNPLRHEDLARAIEAKLKEKNGA